VQNSDVFLYRRAKSIEDKDEVKKWLGLQGSNEKPQLRLRGKWRR
jgi:hypothetical protein